MLQSGDRPRAWRCRGTGDGGLFVWFDPSREHLRILEGVDPDLEKCEVDKQVSMGALDEDEASAMSRDQFTFLLQ